MRCHCRRTVAQAQALLVRVIVVVDPWPKPEHATNNEHDAERNHYFEH
jgi:hypothetical protein